MAQETVTATVQDAHVGETGIKAAEADKLFADVLACVPLIPESDVEVMADLISNQERFGRAWRLLAVLAARDGSFYREVSEDASKAETFASAAGALGGLADTLREASHIADAVYARLMVAGCAHEDWLKWTGAES